MRPNCSPSTKTSAASLAPRDSNSALEPERWTSGEKRAGFDNLHADAASMIH
jgi:hypothetical protein